ncbi:hypothetical protein GCM10020218_090130 [Dactylosporangium vinaceum]
MERTAQWRGWSVVAFTVLAVAASSTVNATPAAADPKPGPVTPHDLDARAPRDVDNRHGTKAPSDRQRDAAGRSGAGPVRWNAFGEPEALAPNAPVPTGLTADSAGAARRYLVDNQDLYGLDATAVAAMDQLMVRPIGTGTVVLLRQRFGGLPAGHDGLVSILLDSGKVVWVSSSLSRDTQAPAPATLSAGDATAAALRDAGLNADHVYRPETTAVAVPTPQDGPRSAYRVTLVSTDTANPAAYTTFVDARTGGVLVRDDQVDFDADNPSWAVFPATPQGPRTTWCYSPQIGCAKTVRDAASGQAWDVDRTTGQPTFTSAGNSAGDVVFWGADSPTFPATAKPSRAYAYPFADQWRRSKCNPTRSPRPAATTPTRPSPTSSPCTTGCTTSATTWASPSPRGTCRSSTSSRAGSATTRSRATPSRARSAAAATTPTRPPAPTASPRSPTCTCGSRSPASATRRAPTATST